MLSRKFVWARSFFHQSTRMEGARRPEKVGRNGPPCPCYGNRDASRPHTNTGLIDPQRARVSYDSITVDIHIQDVQLRLDPCACARFYFTLRPERRLLAFLIHICSRRYCSGHCLPGWKCKTSSHHRYVKVNDFIELNTNFEIPFFLSVAFS